MHIREARSADVARLHTINEASTPGVGSVRADELSRLMAMARLTLVAESGGRASGLILCMTEGTAYTSPNYLWIAARYPVFAYCDRIAIAPDARGKRIGEQLYAAAFNRFAGVRKALFCEVNLAPPNPGSLRFHGRLGFRPVGEAWSPDRTKGVVFLERRLD